MISRLVPDDLRREAESRRPPFWRKSRRSPSGSGAACLEAMSAVRRLNGSVVVPLPGRAPFVLLPSPSEGSIALRPRPSLVAAAPQDFVAGTPRALDGFDAGVADALDGLSWWNPGADVGAFDRLYGSWLKQINDGGRMQSAGDGWLLNCLLTAIATHLSITTPAERPFEAPALEDGLDGLPLEDLITYANDSRGPVAEGTPPRELEKVRDFAAIAEALKRVTWKPGKPAPHGFVLALLQDTEGGGVRGHVYNAALGPYGAAFLDSQSGRPAISPHGADLYFIPVGTRELPQVGIPVAPGEFDGTLRIAGVGTEVELRNPLTGHGDGVDETDVLAEHSSGYKALPLT